MEFNDTYNMLIGGKLVAGSAKLDVLNPATEEVIASVPDATQADLDAAVAAARTPGEAKPAFAAAAAERT